MADNANLNQMTGADSQPRNLARQSLGGRRALIGLLLLAAVLILWRRSRQQCDALALFGAGGRISGLVSFQGDLWLIMTNIEVGEPWTARTESASSVDGLRLQQLLTAGTSDVPPRWVPSSARHWRFFLASQRHDAFGIPGKWCTTLGGPIWLLLPLGAWPLVGWIFRRSRLWRRARRGWCRRCGYDLQGVVTGRCPECGEIDTRAKIAAAAT